MADPFLVPNISPARSLDRANATPAAERANKADFERALGAELGKGPLGTATTATVAPKLKFSAHALERIRDRGLSVDPSEIKKLETAVERAAAKGAKDTLILSGDTAYIVSVTNKTVITALDKNLMNNNVFTNIDSTVIV